MCGNGIPRDMNGFFFCWVRGGHMGEIVEILSFADVPSLAIYQFFGFGLDRGRFSSADAFHVCRYPK